jgi:hypothetical protein
VDNAGFTFEGRLYRTDGAQLEPKPHRRIPIWLGTYGDRALNVTGRLADGWIPSLGYASAEQVTIMRERVRAAAGKAGRDPDEITCAYNIVVRLGDRADPSPSVSRRCRFRTILGSNEPSRSRGTSTWTGPMSVSTVLDRFRLVRHGDHRVIHYGVSLDQELHRSSYSPDRESMARGEGRKHRRCLIHSRESDPSMLADGTIPGSLADVLVVFRCCFTAPTFTTFSGLVVGLIAQTRRRTVCGMLLGACLERIWHHARAHRFFTVARWCVDTVGLVLVDLIVDRLLPAGAAIRVVVNDTLVKRSGRKVFGVAWHHDGAAKGRKPVGLSNCWVVAGIVGELPEVTRPVCPPVLARLWRPGVSDGLCNKISVS